MRCGIKVWNRHIAQYLQPTSWSWALSLSKYVEDRGDLNVCYRCSKCALPDAKDPSEVNGPASESRRKQIPLAPP